MLYSQEVQYIPYPENDKWGIMDLDKNVIIPAKYDSVDFAYYDRSIVKVKGKYGLIDLNGNYILKPKYHSIELEQGKYWTRRMKSSHLRCYTHQGVLTRCVYHMGHGYLNSERYGVGAKVAFDKKDSLYALRYFNMDYCVDRSVHFSLWTNFVDTTDYVYSECNKYGLQAYIVKEDSLYGIFDPFECYSEIECNYQKIRIKHKYHSQIKSNINLFKRDDLWGLVDFNGIEITDAIYKSIQFTSLGTIVRVQDLNGRSFYVNEMGAEFRLRSY